MVRPFFPLSSFLIVRRLKNRSTECADPMCRESPSFGQTINHQWYPVPVQYETLHPSPAASVMNLEVCKNLAGVSSKKVLSGTPDYLRYTQILTLP